MIDLTTTKSTDDMKYLNQSNIFRMQGFFDENQRNLGLQKGMQNNVSKSCILNVIISKS